MGYCLSLPFLVWKGTQHSLHFVQTRISQQLWDGLPRDFVQTLMVLRGWIFMTFLIHWHFFKWGWHFWFWVKYLNNRQRDCPEICYIHCLHCFSICCLYHCAIMRSKFRFVQYFCLRLNTSKTNDIYISLSYTLGLVLISKCQHANMLS